LARKKADDINLKGFEGSDYDALSVSDTDYSECSVSGADNVLQESASDNKKIFDAFPKIVAAKLNGLINKLKGGNFVQDANYVHTDNNYTTDEKNKLTKIEGGAQVNVIESVKVNGSGLSVSNKSVDVSVPTKLSELNNDGNFVQDSNYVHTDNNYDSAEKNKVAAANRNSNNASQIVAFNNYEEFVEYFNGHEYLPGNVQPKPNQIIVIKDPNVPHLLVKSVYASINPSIYEFESNEKFLADMERYSDDGLIVGYHAFSLLETKKDALPTKTSDLLNDSNFVQDANYVHTDNNYTDLQRIADETIASNSYITFSQFSFINGMPMEVSVIRLLDSNLENSISVGDLMYFTGQADTVFIRVVNIYPDASVPYSSYTEFKESLVANKVVRLGLYGVELIADVDVSQIDKYVNTIVYLTKNAVNYPTKEEMNSAIVEGDPKYELIQTIRVEDSEVTEFTFNVDSNGDTFKLDAIVVRLMCAATPNTTSYWRVGTTDSNSTYFHYFKPDSGGDTIILKSERMSNGFWLGMRSRNSSTATNCPIYTSQIAFAVDYAESIYMKFAGISPASTITVYGRRVN